MKEAIDLNLDDEMDIKRDAVIQRFEFTFELLWKLIKKIAKREQIDVVSPRSAFKVGFRLQIINDEKQAFSLIEARNLMSHVYSQEYADNVYDLINKSAVKVFDESQERIQVYVDEM